MIDTRASALYAAGTCPVPSPAASPDHGRSRGRLPPDVLLVTYCNGPHCNASTRGALRVAALGRQVKEMPGGMDGWIREGLPVEL